MVNSKNNFQNIFTRKEENDKIKEKSILNKMTNLISSHELQATISNSKNQKPNNMLKTVKSVKIPKEKLEQERLKSLTGEWNLGKVKQQDLDNRIRLKNKTPDDYYTAQIDDDEMKKRLDEAFGPKTDFSISNYENNYNKFNQEEKEMFTKKMQVVLNHKGYTDKNGFKLKPDGVLGNKTKEVYETYKKDNPSDYKEAIELKNYKPEMKSKKDSTFNDLELMPIYATADARNNDRNTELLTSRGDDSKRTLRQYLEEESKKSKKNQADSTIKNNSPYIIEAAQKYGVNPGILGAIIYTEQIKNVDMLDSMDAILGSVGVDTSIGVGQVKISTAKMLEDKGYMPKISKEEGSNKSERQLRIEALKDNKTNIEYAAAYLKYYQDRWEEVYPEIDGRTAVLATLYNQGETKLPHANPEPNDFGEDAKSYYYYVRELLGLK